MGISIQIHTYLRDELKIKQIVILIVEIMNLLKLDHHGKHGSTGRLFRPIVGLLSSSNF